MGVGPGGQARDLVQAMLSDSSLPRFYFDFVDPLSYLLAHELAQVPGPSEVPVEWIGIEIVPTSHPLAAPSDPVWAERWALAADVARELGVPLATPPLVPWTRKAHELVMHAAASGRATEVREALFRAFFVEGRDIGRVDVLVAIARDQGLDLTETKAVLDVDRYDAEVADRRAEALRSGLRTVPTLTAGERVLEGFHNGPSLSTFLHGSR